MGILLKAQDANFSNYIAVAEYPIINALKNLYYIRGNAEISVADHSGNGNNGTVTGTVAFEQNYATFNGAPASSAIILPNAMNVGAHIAGIVAYKATGDRMLLGELSPSTASAGKGFNFASNKLYYAIEGGAGTQILNFSVTKNANFNIVAFRISETTIKVYQFTGGVLVEIASQSISNGIIRNDTANRTIYVGGNYYNFGDQGSVSIACASYYEGIVTNEQLNGACSFVKTYMDIIGLSVN